MAADTTTDVAAPPLPPRSRCDERKRCGRRYHDEPPTEIAGCDVRPARPVQYTVMPLGGTADGGTVTDRARKHGEELGGTGRNGEERGGKGRGEEIGGDTRRKGGVEG